MLVMKFAKRLVKKFLVKILPIANSSLCIIPFVYCFLKRAVLCDLGSSDHLHMSSLRITLEMGHKQYLYYRTRGPAIVFVQNLREKQIPLFTGLRGKKGTIKIPYSLFYFLNNIIKVCFVLKKYVLLRALLGGRPRTSPPCQLIYFCLV